MRVDCRMEVGLGKQDIEDRILVENTIMAGGVYTTSIPRSKPFIIAVADGVGGNNAGDLAAHIAVEGLLSMYLGGIDCVEALEARITQINARIIEQSQQNQRLNRMATTLSGLYFTGEKWLLFHVGNSRVYLLDTPYLRQITSDHTWASEMLQAGLTEEEVQRSGKSSTITSCLGNGDALTAGKLQVFDVTPSIEGAKSIFLTTDGIHDFIPHAMLERGVISGTPADELLRLCMELARNRGSEDDLSMICLSFEENQEKGSYIDAI